MKSNEDPDEDIHDGDDYDDMTQIEDYEVEGRGGYARISIDEISQDDAATVMAFLDSVINKRIVPKVIWDKE
jgi:hypothetical protein